MYKSFEITMEDEKHYKIYDDIVVNQIITSETHMLHAQG